MAYDTSNTQAEVLGGQAPDMTPNPDLEKKNKETIKYVDDKKKEMKKSQYRERFDNLAGEIELNLMNTAVTYGQKLYEKSGWGSMVFYNKMSNGAYDINVYPQKLTDRDQNRSGVPVSQEPIAFSKIMIATSVLAGKLPDATVVADDKVYAHAAHFLWKRSWENRGGNGSNALMLIYQNLFTYGWGAWRVYPRRVQVPRNGVDKILFDDIYREPLDPKRTWLGVGFTLSDSWSQYEVYYEKDIPKDQFYVMYPNITKKDKKKLEYCAVSEEAKDENSEKIFTHVTIGYYENVLLNKFVVKSGTLVIFDGEMPNDDSYGSIVVVRCFARNMNDPYGVGLYEMMRGNTALYTYINSLNAQQVEAEIFPLLFGPQVQNGTGTYKRGPNIVNPKTPGSTIDIVRTTGNVAQGIAFGDKQKENIEQNTGVNNIVAGQNAENTLGSTVILKEAAYNRLTPPRNSVVDGLGLDAKIANSWIKQTYTVDKVFMIDSDEQLAEFAKQNPGYFIESADVVDVTGNKVGNTVTASQNLRMNFDFTPDGQILENVPTRTISAKGLFDEMAAHGHKSDYIEFIIDPDSMLLPSIEIQKQTFMAIYPVITNTITQIFALRNTDPDAAASQLMSLEQLLEIQRLDIYKFISKQDYDDIMAKKPSQAQIAMQQAAQAAAPSDETKPHETLNYKDAPEDVRREIEVQAGLQPSKIGGGPTSIVTNKPKEKKKTDGKSMMKDGNNPLKPQNANEMPRPQSPMMGAIDASVGRAANLPFFPGA